MLIPLLMKSSSLLAVVKLHSFRGHIYISVSEDCFYLANSADPFSLIVVGPIGSGLLCWFLVLWCSSRCLF